MTGRYLACRDCGAPLEIVCPTHGRTVSRVHTDTGPVHAVRPRVRQARVDRGVLKPGTRRYEIVQLMSTRGGEFLASDIAIMFSIPSRIAAIELCNLSARGHIDRVWTGVYRAKAPADA